MRSFWIVAACALLAIVAVALPAGAQAPSTRFYLPMIGRDPTPTPSAIQIRYEGHAQDHGWMGWQSESAIAGTEDDGKRLEAFRAEVVTGSGVTIRYRAHISGIGWQEWKQNGQIAGTVGEQRPIEAIQMTLVNAAGANWLSVETRAEGWGWLGPVKDSWIAGTTGQARKITAFRARVRHDKAEPAAIKVAYNAALQDTGEQGWKRNGEEAGVTGEQRRLEALKVLLYNHPETMGIDVRANVEGEWQDWRSNGAQAGTTGEAKRITAIELRLTNAYTGTVLSYGAHFQNRGWIEYASDNPSKNNPILGNPTDLFRLEAFRLGLGHATE